MVSDNVPTLVYMVWALRSVRGKRPWSDSPRASSRVASGRKASATSCIAACTALRASDTRVLACTTSLSCFSSRVSSMRAVAKSSLGSLTPTADTAARCTGTNAAGGGLGCARMPSMDATPDVLGSGSNSSPEKTWASDCTCAAALAACLRCPSGASASTGSGS